METPTTDNEPQGTESPSETEEPSKSSLSSNMLYDPENFDPATQGFIEQTILDCLLCFIMITKPLMNCFDEI